jgi:hypothetical protein
LVAQTPDSVANSIIMSAAMDKPSNCSYRNFYDWWHFRLTCRFVDENGRVYYEYRRAKR